MHYSCTDMSKFIQHTPETFQELLDDLRACRAAVTNAQFKLAEQSAGINIDEAVLVQSHMKNIANVPMSRYVYLVPCYRGQWWVHAVPVQPTFAGT